MSSFRSACVLVLSFPVLIAGCGSSNNGGGGGGSNTPLTLTLGSSMVIAAQGNGTGTLTYTVSGGSSATVAVTQLPNGVTDQITQPDANGAGSITFTAAATTPAGTYTAQVSCSDTRTVTQNFTLVVAGYNTVGASTDTTLGLNGQLKQFMSTSFQPASWDYQFFQNHPTTEPSQLATLGPQHIRIQALAVPWLANSNPQQSTDWNFSQLDAIVQPILTITDHSPEFQIAITPSFFSLPSPLTANDPNLALFVTYCKNLVLYYNKGGFTWGGTTFKSPGTYPIAWWGIFNEYNINGLTASDYVVLYNAVVPAMLAIDPTIKFSALELSDYDYEQGDPRNNLPTFVASPASGGVNAQVNVTSTHFYSTCDQTDTDATIFATIPSFANDVEYFRSELSGSSNPNLSSVAVWVTENNVNADYESSNGDSTCNPGQKFVLDQRGTSPFFAAWRPYVFSQLAKAGNQALYHWDYGADAQYSEVDYTSDAKYLSYWVDYTLGQLFPVTTTTNPEFLEFTATETATVESLATKNPDGSYVIMITNRAVNAPTDNNGPGAPRTVIVDVSALGNYTSVSQVTLDTNTNVSNGPSTTTLTPASKFSVTLSGYGTTFLHIQP